jgi:predicted NAD/FAD-dependent oxidoreductase
VSAWRDRGLVIPWTGRVVVLDQGRLEPEKQPPERFVGAPGMNAVCAHLAQDLEVRFNVRVTRLEQRGARWLVRGDVNQALGSFDAVVVSAPSPQTAVLLADAVPRLAARAEAVDMQPCWAVMVAFDAPLELGFDGAFVQKAPLRWVCRNTSKEARPAAEAWVLHASPEWSEKHIELDRETVARRLLETFGDSVQRTLPTPTHLVAHRWRFALPVNPLSEACIHDSSSAVFGCGDWCAGPKVEGAYLSGRAAAARLLEVQMKASRRPA